jgi:hypothetical protein
MEGNVTNIYLGSEKLRRGGNVDVHEHITCIKKQKTMENIER